MWQALLNRAGERASLGWLNHLQLVELTDDHASIRPAAGQQSMADFLTPPRLAEIARLLELIVGNQIAVQIARPAKRADDQTSDQPTPGQSANVSAHGELRRTIFGLPLVRELLDVFPDATPTDMYHTSDRPPADADLNTGAPDGDLPLPPPDDAALDVDDDDESDD